MKEWTCQYSLFVENRSEFPDISINREGSPSNKNLQITIRGMKTMKNERYPGPKKIA